jgi:hypothetical protein
MVCLYFQNFEPQPNSQLKARSLRCLYLQFLLQRHFHIEFLQLTGSIPPCFEFSIGSSCFPVHGIQKNMSLTNNCFLIIILQSWQKRYTNRKCREVEFKERGKVFLKVTPMKLWDLGRGESLAPGCRSLWHSEKDQISSCSTFYSTRDSHVFHISMPSNYVPDPSHMLEVEPLQVC